MHHSPLALGERVRGMRIRDDSPWRYSRIQARAVAPPERPGMAGARDRDGSRRRGRSGRARACAQHAGRGRLDAAIEGVGPGLEAGRRPAPRRSTRSGVVDESTLRALFSQLLRGSDAERQRAIARVRTLAGRAAALLRPALDAVALETGEARKTCVEILAPMTEGILTDDLRTAIQRSSACSGTADSSRSPWNTSPACSNKEFGSDARIPCRTVATSAIPQTVPSRFASRWPVASR